MPTTARPWLASQEHNGQMRAAAHACILNPEEASRTMALSEAMEAPHHTCLGCRVHVL